MGAWGCRSFENDDAMDFAAEVLRGGMASVVDALGVVSGAGAAEAGRALAAAEMVAAMLGHPAIDLPDDVRAWCVLQRDSIDPQPAREAVIAVLSDSELADLWKESEEYRQWKVAVQHLLKRLGGTMPTKAEKPPRPKNPSPRKDHPGVPSLDTRGLKTLLTHFRDTPIEPATLVSTDDERYALETGFFVMPREMTHNEVIDWTCRAVGSVSLIDVSNAFLASLSSRRLELRSALGRYAVGLYLPRHQYLSAGICCAICGLIAPGKKRYEFSGTNCGRYTGGGVSDYPDDIAFDLSEFAKLPPCIPTEDDIAIFRKIISVAASLPPNAGPGVLVKQLQGLFSANTQEIERLVTILGYCGILQSAKYPSFHDRYVSYADRGRWLQTDWCYPIEFWRGRDGVNRQALAFYFPQITEW